jgi:hypothetical protein
MAAKKREGMERPTRNTGLFSPMFILPLSGDSATYGALVLPVLSGEFLDYRLRTRGGFRS